MRMPGVATIAMFGPCLTFVILTDVTEATTYIVKPDGSGDFSTIQSALDSARSGDTINLGAGTFVGAGNRDLDFLAKAVVLRAVTAGFVTINCEGQPPPATPHRGFHFHSGEGLGSVVDGITVTGGHIEPFDDPDNPASYSGGAVFCLNSSPTIRNCRFSGNYAIQATVSCRGSSPIIENCLFEHNTGGNTNGLDCWYGSSPIVTNCTFRENSGGLAGGGASCHHQSNAVFTDCHFADNSADGIGGGFYVQYAGPRLIRCTFSGNQAADRGGGAFLIEINEPLIVEDCQFVDNMALNGGGGLQCDHLTTVRNTAFIGNSTRVGGGVFAYGSATGQNPQFIDCEFYDNTGTYYGGGGSFFRDTTFESCRFEGNDSQRGGGLAIGDNWYDTWPTSGQVRNCLFANNTAVFWGGGIYCGNSDTHASFAGCTFVENAAPDGGGIFLDRSSSSLALGSASPMSSRRVGSPLVENNPVPSPNECMPRATPNSVSLTQSIVAFGSDGTAVSVVAGTVAVLSCVDLYGNADGDWVGSIADQNGVDGNFSQDPLFCRDLNPNDPWAVGSASPCLPGQHPAGVACGLIGARPEGCAIVSVPQEPSPPTLLSVSPSPARGPVTFHFPQELGPITLEILDSTGRAIRVFGPSEVSSGRVVWDGKVRSIDQDAPPGVYFVRLADRTGPHTARLVRLP